MDNQTLSKGEREALRETMRERKSNVSKAEALEGVLEKIAAMVPADRKLAERIHALVNKHCPELEAKTWYGMQAYFKNGKVICFFQDAGKFKSRYCTLGFQQDANLDSGAMWPTSFALLEITGAVEKEIVELLKKAVS